MRYKIAMLSLDKVYDHLVSCSTKWLKLGLQLGVSIEELNKIEYQWKNPDDCLIHMLECWLKQQSKRPPPSWSDLVAALNKESISENALANKLEELYITGESLVTWQLLAISVSQVLHHIIAKLFYIGKGNKILYRYTHYI